jgi:hypothetical protein
MEYPSLMASPLVSDDLDWVKPTLAKAIAKRKTLAATTATLTLPPPPKPEQSPG